MEESERDPNEELTPTEVTIAELIDDVGRDIGTLRFLLDERGSPAAEEVSKVLSELVNRELAAQDASGQYRLTDDGKAQLRAGQEWVFDVVEVFRVSFADKPLLQGHLRCGVVRRKDWFRTAGGIVGHVESVEFISGRSIPPDQFVLRVDRDGIEPGDTLHRTELLAG